MLVTWNPRRKRCRHWPVSTFMAAAPLDLRQTTQLPNRLAATTRQPAGASGRLARAGCPAGQAASITVTSPTLRVVSLTLTNTPPHKFRSNWPSPGISPFELPCHSAAGDGCGTHPRTPVSAEDPVRTAAADSRPPTGRGPWSGRNARPNLQSGSRSGPPARLGPRCGDRRGRT